MRKGTARTGRRGRPELPAAVGIGASLRQARLEAGLTLAQVAAPVYTAGYLSQVERGLSSPSAEALAHFNRRLGLELAPVAHFALGERLFVTAPRGLPLLRRCDPRTAGDHHRGRDHRQRRAART
jgi:transcriptional regulator with XRE-family HTH domain